MRVLPKSQELTFVAFTEFPSMINKDFFLCDLRLAISTVNLLLTCFHECSPITTRANGTASPRNRFIFWFSVMNFQIDQYKTSDLKNFFLYWQATYMPKLNHLEQTVLLKTCPRGLILNLMVWPSPLTHWLKNQQASSFTGRHLACKNWTITGKQFCLKHVSKFDLESYGVTLTFGPVTSKSIGFFLY